MPKRVTHLSDNGPMAIDGGRHPILESIHNDIVVCIFPFLIVWFLVSDSFLCRTLSFLFLFRPLFFFCLFIYFYFFFKYSAVPMELNLFHFAAQQSLSLRSIKYGDCHGAKHVRKCFHWSCFMHVDWSFSCIACFPWEYLVIFSFSFTVWKKIGKYQEKRRREKLSFVQLVTGSLW
jgi:hypothetical protein